MASSHIIASLANPDISLIQTALNGMEAIENLLCDMHNQAVLALSAATAEERRQLACRFDRARAELDVIAADTLGVGKACGDNQIFPAEYLHSTAAVLAVCEAEGSDMWLRLAGLPPHGRFPAGRGHHLAIDGHGNLDLPTIGDVDSRAQVIDAIYTLLNGNTVLVRAATGMAQPVNHRNHPNMRLYINVLRHGWAEPVGYQRAIERSVTETSAALKTIQVTPASFGAYVSRLCQRYGLKRTPANDG